MFKTNWETKRKSISSRLTLHKEELKSRFVLTATSRVYFRETKIVLHKVYVQRLSFLLKKLKQSCLKEGDTQIESCKRLAAPSSHLHDHHRNNQRSIGSNIPLIPSSLNFLKACHGIRFMCPPVLDSRVYHLTEWLYVSLSWLAVSSLLKNVILNLRQQLRFLVMFKNSTRRGWKGMRWESPKMMSIMTSHRMMEWISYTREFVERNESCWTRDWRYWKTKRSWRRWELWSLLLSHSHHAFSVV